jgi:3-oxoacyl-[acyl-carrier-protein] synthase III
MSVLYQLSGISVVPGEIEMSISELASAHDTTESAIMKSLGSLRVRRTERHALDLASDAARAACAQRGISPTEIDLLIFCSYRSEDEPRIARLGRDIGNPTVPLIRILGSCDVLVQAIEIARSWLGRTGGQRALLVYADKMKGPRRTDGAISEETKRSVMSDAAAALFVEPGAGLTVLGCGSHYELLVAERGPDAKPRSQAEELKMLIAYVGSSRAALARCLTEAGVAQSDVRWFVHPLETEVVASFILSKLGAPLDRRLTNPAGISHPFGADAFFELSDALGSGRIGKGDLVEVVAQGHSSVHCMILRQD